MKKLLAIGDSLSLPRFGVSYENNWGYKLKNNFPNLDMIYVFQRSITTNVLIEWGGGGKEPKDNLPFGSDFWNIIILILLFCS